MFKKIELLMISEMKSVHYSVINSWVVPDNGHQTRVLASHRSILRLKSASLSSFNPQIEENRIQCLPRAQCIRPFTEIVPSFVQN